MPSTKGKVGEIIQLRPKIISERSVKMTGSWKFILRFFGACSVVMAIILASATAYAEAPQPIPSQPSSTTVLLPGGCGIVGDVNYDGVVDYYDLRELVDHWHSSTVSDRSKYDLVPNGRVAVASAMKLLLNIGVKCPFDPLGVQMFNEYKTPDGRGKAIHGNLHWARIYLFSWKNMEPTDGASPDWGWYDYLVQQAQQDGLRIIATIQGNPNWAATTACGPIDMVPLSRYSDFIIKLVKRYGGHGGPDTMPGLTSPIKYWELGNEPDWDRVEGAPGACFGGNVNAATNPNTDAYEYADMLKTLYPAIKNVDPTAQVVFGSIAYEPNPNFNIHFPDEVLQRLSTDPNVNTNNCYFDMIGFHQYDAYRSNWDSLNRPSTQGLLGKVNALKTVLSGYNYCANKPLLVTEMGLQIGESGQQDDPTQLEMQARHIARMYFEVYASGVPIAIWYALEDQSETYKYGLFPSGPKSDQARPAYFVIRNLTEFMKGYTFERQINLDPNIQSFMFAKSTDSSHKRIALWFDNGQRIKALSPPDAFNVTARIPSGFLPDWNGRIRLTKRAPESPNTYGLNYTPTVISSAGNPFVEFTLTSDPVIVEADILSQ
ncbi:MAG: hypothetical protein EXR62_18085 [Chloroflexi bacterium]|nr:hypothetical protein [Chloroflexota bacterium]